METYFTVKRAILVLGLLAMPALAGCQTTAGFGRDVQSTGRWIEGGAQDTQAWMFGSSAQAAEAKSADTSSEQTITPAAGGNVVYFTTGSAEVRRSKAVIFVGELWSAAAPTVKKSAPELLA